MKIDKNCLACNSIKDCIDVLDCRNQRQFAAGDLVYSMGDHQDGVWQVLSGLIALRVYTESGDVVLLRLATRGAVFGYRSFLTNEPRSCSAQAITPAELKHVPASMLARMMEREPRLGHALQLSMAEAFRDTQERILRMATQSARVKFLNLCAWLAEADGGSAAAGGFSVRLPITFQDIAQILSVSPETMSRTTRRLQADRIITMNGRLVTVAGGWTDYCSGDGAQA